MKNLPVLLVSLLVAFTLLACAPTTGGGSQAAPASAEPWNGGHTDLHGMPVEYWVADEAISFGDLTFALSADWFTFADASNNRCIVNIDRSRIPEVTSEMLAKELAVCFYMSSLDVQFEQGTPEYMDGAFAFSDAFAAAYVRECGQLLEPLAWNNATDGTCDIPDPRAVDW